MRRRRKRSRRKSSASWLMARRSIAWRKCTRKTATRDLGGDWGWIERKTLAAPLEKVAFNLPAGRVSHVIELGPNYYILQGRRKARRRDAVVRQASARDREKVDAGRIAAAAGALARRPAPEGLHPHFLVGHSAPHDEVVSLVGRDCVVQLVGRDSVEPALAPAARYRRSTLRVTA